MNTELSQMMQPFIDYIAYRHGLDVRTVRTLVAALIEALVEGGAEAVVIQRRVTQHTTKALRRRPGGGRLSAADARVLRLFYDAGQSLREASMFTRAFLSFLEANFTLDPRATAAKTPCLALLMSPTQPSSAPAPAASEPEVG